MTKTGIVLAKKELRQLIDKIPDSELKTAKRFLQYLVSLKEEDPVLKALENAPISHEPLTDDEKAALREAYKDIKAGRILSDKEVSRLLQNEQNEAE